MQNLAALFRTSAVALSGVLLIPAAAAAADGEQTSLGLGEAAKEETTNQVGASGGSIVRTIVGLAVVIGVIYGLTWVLKQVKAAQDRRHHRHRPGDRRHAAARRRTARCTWCARARSSCWSARASTASRRSAPTRRPRRARWACSPDAEPAAGSMDALEPEVFGAETRRGRFIDELRKRTVIK